MWAMIISAPILLSDKIFPSSFCPRRFRFWLTATFLSRASFCYSPFHLPPGLYFKLHGTHRPEAMKKTVIKRRRRVPAVNGATANTNQAQTSPTSSAHQPLSSSSSSAAANSVSALSHQLQAQRSHSPLSAIPHHLELEQQAAEALVAVGRSSPALPHPFSPQHPHLASAQNQHHLSHPEPSVEPMSQRVTPLCCFGSWAWSFTHAWTTGPADGRVAGLCISPASSYRGGR